MFARREEDKYDLKTSYESFGCLQFCLTDKFGNLVDGFHRKKIDPNWPEVKNPMIDTPEKLAVARLVVNLHRRKLDFQEKREQLGSIIVFMGWTPDEASKYLSMSRSWVYNHLPTDLLKRQVLHVLHKRVDPPRRGQDRLAESKALAGLLKDIENPNEPPSKEIAAAFQTGDAGPLLPYPDCRCSGQSLGLPVCRHMKKCRFLWG